MEARQISLKTAQGDEFFGALRCRTMGMSGNQALAGVHVRRQILYGIAVNGFSAYPPSPAECRHGRCFSKPVNALRFPRALTAGAEWLGAIHTLGGRVVVTSDAPFAPADLLGGMESLRPAYRIMCHIRARGIVATGNTKLICF
jgi:hypothetical protein